MFQTTNQYIMGIEIDGNQYGDTIGHITTSILMILIGTISWGKTWIVNYRFLSTQDLAKPKV